LSGIQPCLPKIASADVIALNESVHESLVSGTTELDDDVVNRESESWIPKQRKPEPVRWFVVVLALTQGNDRM